MTATATSGLAPLSQVDIDVTDDPVRELMRRYESTEFSSEVDLELPIPEQRGFMIGDVRL